MMELINKLQFKTVNFYNKYLEQDKSVKSVHHKVVTDSMEFFSSFFYSFLFCVFILVVDCMGKDDMPWLINAVCLTAIVSFTYWILIWGHYWWSIKKREGNTDLISYEFKFWTCVLVFIAMIAIIGLANIINLKTEIMNYIYIGGIVFIGIFAMLNYIKRRKCVFTHYFNLIHFFLVIFYIGILSWLQERFLLNDIHFTAESAKFLSILFILLSGLIFPLFIPFLRLKWEIGYTNIKLNRAKRRYIKDTQKLKDKLNAHFDNLNKLRTLVAKKETLK